MMPALAAAMSARVGPSSFTWSIPSAVMTAHSGGSMTLVESSVPPRPTSSTTMSHFSSANQSIPRAVIISNSVGTSAMASAAGRTRSTRRTNASSGICSPFT